MRATAVGADRYSRVAIAFHWVIAALIAVNLILGLFAGSLPEDWRVMPVHKAIGITVLVLTLGRLWWRVVHPAPPLPATMPVWERSAAHVSHFALYAFMLVMPLTGWAMVSGPRRRPLDWFSLFDIPYLPVSAEVAGLSHDLHELLGWGFLALILVHVGAALRHHLILRDNVLHRMLPGVAAPGPRV